MGLGTALTCAFHHHLLTLPALPATTLQPLCCSPHPHLVPCSITPTSWRSATSPPTSPPQCWVPSTTWRLRQRAPNCRQWAQPPAQQPLRRLGLQQRPAAGSGAEGVLQEGPAGQLMLLAVQGQQMRPQEGQQQQGGQQWEGQGKRQLQLRVPVQPQQGV